MNKSKIAFSILLLYTIIICSIVTVSAITWDNIAYYELNETAGVLAQDSTSNSYNGTCINCEGNEWTTSGILNGAIELDYGVDDTEFINVPDNADLDAIKTISFWYYNIDTGGSADGRTLISKGADYNSVIGYTDDLNVIFYRVGNVKVVNAEGILVNDWTHVVVTSTGTNVTLWINGVQNESASTNLDFDNAYNLTIGGNWVASRTMDGRIDEVGLWTRVLTNSEILELYNNGNGLEFNSNVISVHSPEDNYKIYETDVLNTQFNVTGSVDGSVSNITNMSLYYNNSGVWTIADTDNLVGQDLSTYNYVVNKTLNEVNGTKWAVEMCTEIECIFTSNRTIVLEPVYFTLCNSSYKTRFLNISFKDEDDSSVINATIPTSTFTYYLGDGSSTKTYQLTNNTLNYNYEFCSSINRTLNVNSYIQYKSEDYPQRVYENNFELSNTTTDLTLYLLNIVDGLYVTFQVINSAEQTISNVDVTIDRVIDSSNQTVAQGTTDAAGAVTFWLNPDFIHYLNFTKSGYASLSQSLFPTQTTYTVTLGGGTIIGTNDYTQGININIYPIGNSVLFNTSTNFNFTLSSSYWDVEEFGYILSYSNGTSILSNSSSASGGTLNSLITTPLLGGIVMDYYYVINSTYINGSTTWIVYSPSSYSLHYLINHTISYIDADLFGILGDDNGYFAKAIISILLIIMVAGVVSIRYGLNSDVAVSCLIFAMVLFLNSLGFIPTPEGLTFINLGDFLVTITAIIILATIIKEELR